MDTKRLMTFIELAGQQTRALDLFVEGQRAVAGAVRARDCAALEQALEHAAMLADAVAAAEEKRVDAWAAFLGEAKLPVDSTVFKASLSLPLEYRAVLNDAYRALRLSSMRARIENEALSYFVGDAATTLRQAIETLFPERKGKIYGKSGKANHANSAAMILDQAF